ncbi:MAG: glucosyltransferase domain-containing protein [Acutalibacteraceae bacterium]|nr:glucosyltransferase domain-containing protein [Acutalibacteraceae bacterium]
MGEAFVKFYREKIKSHWKIAFTAVMVIGLLTHIYKFTNLLLNHDTAFNFYHDQNMIRSGRWFLTIACMFSTYFDLPWVIGLFSLVFIGLTAVLIVEMFNIDKPIPCILIAGILVTFPAVTNTFFYQFTADGYMLAMLMSALAIYLTTLEKRKILFSVIGVILLCLSCGTYQAYLSFGLMLVACDFIIKLIDGKLSNKDCFKYIGKYLIIFACALVLYYAVWKILMKIQGVVPVEYQGINNVGTLNINLVTIFSVIRSFGGFFVKEGIGDIYSILNILFVICSFVAGVYVVIRKKIYERKIQLGLLFLACLAMPYCIYAIRFISPTAFYYTIMLQSFSLVYILLVIIADKYVNLKLKNTVAILLCMIIFNFSIMANKAYYIMDLNNKSMYAQTLKLVTRIDQEMTSSDMKVAFIGDFDAESHISEEVPIKIFYSEGMNLYGGILDSSIKNYTKKLIEADYNWASFESRSELSRTEEVKNMPLWPLGGSVKVIDDTVVIKMEDIVYE